MSLNKFMHPRNRYKIARPNFEALGQKYPEFKMHLVDNSKGKPALDFQNPEALRVLTICMMKEDYGLNIELPPDRLVPTLPLRLNYVHWIEDMTKDWNKEELKAIDIGTGACCVYPVLAISANPWQFLATEADEVNFSYAVKNMEENKLTKRIKVVKVSTSTILEGVIGQTEDAYDFCMCNPPFFADHFEAQGLVSRSPSRPDAKTMSTASPQEGIVQGGEVGFVRRMIEESNFLQGRVRVYTTMLGKKASLAPLKEILRRHKITHFATTEFCQGKTMRWGLAWSFDKSVTFPKSLFSQGKKEGKKSVVHIIPTQVGGRREPVYDLVIFFKQMFSQMKIHFREGKQTKFFSLLTLTAAENTWIHSRRKRRQMLRESPTKSATVTSESSSQPASASQHEGNSDSASVSATLGSADGVKDDGESVMTSATDSVKDDSESVMTTSAADGVKDDSESVMTTSAADGVKDDSESVMTTSAADDVKDDSKSVMTTSAADGVKDDSESVMTTSAADDVKDDSESVMTTSAADDVKDDSESVMTTSAADGVKDDSESVMTTSAADGVKDDSESVMTTSAADGVKDDSESVMTTSAADGVKDDSESVMTTSAADGVKDDSESVMTTSAADGVKDDSKSVITTSATQDTCSGVEADRRPAASSMAVEGTCHNAEHRNGSALTTSTFVDGTDTPKDQGQEVHGTAMQSHSSADGENHKRKYATVESSDSPPTKRVKLDSCAPSSDTSSDTKCDKMNSDAEVVESSDSSPKLSTAECAEPQSNEVEASEETYSTAQSSSGGAAPSAGEETDCCSADTPSKEGGEGGRGKDRPPAQFVLKCHMCVRVQGSDLAVELTWLDGQDIQLMHQLMQVFKNHLAERK